MELRLYNTEQLRTRLIQLDRRRISVMYDEASKRLQEAANDVANRVPNEAVLNIGMYDEVLAEARKEYDQIRRRLGTQIEYDMLTVSEETFNEFSSNLISYGMPEGNFFLGVPRSVVQNILNGTVYLKPDNLGIKDFNWGLSKALWGDNRKTISDIYKVVATGVAQGKSSMEIAQDIEKYTNPAKDKKRDFDWSKVYPNVKTKIDYNASRLARTLLNHAYQQSFKQAGEKNPWISYYVWHSAFAHNRTCAVCEDLDGQKFRKEGDITSDLPELPLDHPNGLCVWTYEFDTRSMIDDLADWVNETGDPERNRQIDEYERYLKGR